MFLILFEDALLQAIISLTVGFFFYLILPKEKVKRFLLGSDKGNEKIFNEPNGTNDKKSKVKRIPLGFATLLIGFILFCAIFIFSLKLYNRPNTLNENEKIHNQHDTLNETKLREEISKIPEKDTSIIGLVVGSSEISGFGDRKILNYPKIPDIDGTKIGRREKLTLNICIDSNGNVIDATINHKESTSKNFYLISILLPHAKKYKFSKATVDRKCGYIEHIIKLR